MKLTFLGAAHEVTGSCYYLEACGKKILVDCGMEQGRDCFVNQSIPVKATDIDMVLLTHAHIDHSGKLPLLAKEGFRGPIHSTEGTRSLCHIMLLDSAHIQEFEAEWKNRKGKRAGRDEVVPMYDTNDAQAAVKLFVGHPYREEFQLTGGETEGADGIRVQFIDAGHLLGSASIILWITEEGVTKKVIFSGDIGNTDQPLINDPTYPDTADYVIMESTYGDRAHDKPADYASKLAEVIQRTFDRGGNVVIPSFAVGRTQEMLYFIRRIKNDHMVHGHDQFEVYVDSPLAVEATNIFMERMYDDFDEEASALVKQGINPISFPGLRTSVSSDESRAINFNTTPKVILSASGMCDAGRIKHHLKHNLWRPESSIVFVGYQAEGTLGRALLEGAKHVRLFGEDIEVRSDICMLPGISGHADNAGLIRWIRSLENTPARVFVTHGEAQTADLFTARLHNELGLNSYAPYSGTIFDLAKNVFDYEAQPVPVKKEETEKAQDSAPKKERREEYKLSKTYMELVEAGQHLLDVIGHNEGGANKDLRSFAAEINKLADRWDR